METDQAAHQGELIEFAKICRLYVEQSVQRISLLDLSRTLVLFGVSIQSDESVDIAQMPLPARLALLEIRRRFAEQFP